MEFFIKKNSTLPKLQVEVIKESRNGYNQLDSLISASTVTFSMYDVESGVYRIAGSPATIKEKGDGSGYIVSYKFSKKFTKKKNPTWGTHCFACQFKMAAVPVGRFLKVVKNG